MDTEKNTKYNKHYLDVDRNMPYNEKRILSPSNEMKPIVNPKFKLELESLLEELKTTLFDKNRKYGNSAFENIGIFHKGDRLVSINARIDDKLARKMQDVEDEDEDIDFDLLGYLIFRILINRGKL